MSVVVPCYRYGHYVAQCVKSLLTNTSVELDVLVIDDASPDDSWGTVQDLPRLDSRVRVERHEQNAGLIATANEGIAQARGDYFVLLSADDSLAPGWLDRGVAALERHPDASFTLGPVRTFVTTPASARARLAHGERLWSGIDWIARSCRAGVTLVRSPEVIARTSSQVAVGGYNPALPYSSDMEMWLRLASIGNVVEVTGAVAAYYRVHEQNMSRGAHAHALSDLLYRKEAFDGWYVSSVDAVPNAAELRGTAYAAIAKRALLLAVTVHMQEGRESGARDRLVQLAIDCDPGLASKGHRLVSALDRPVVTRICEAAQPLTHATTRLRRAIPAWRARSPLF